MPILGGSNLKKIILPSSVEGDEAWVQINASINAEVALILNGSQGKSNAEQAQMIFEALSRIIIDWNFTLADGATKAPITKENVGKLDIKDLVAIQQAVDVDEKTLEEAKKKASSSSSPQITPTA